MIKTAGRVFISCAAAIILMQMACAQGLKGAPTCIRRLTQSPALLKGANDEERWATFLRSQKSLIGMSRAQVLALFGAGTPSVTKKGMAFKLTEERLPSKKGQVAYLELSLKFEG